MTRALVLAVLVASATAFTPPSTFVSRPASLQPHVVVASPSSVMTSLANKSRQTDDTDEEENTTPLVSSKAVVLSWAATATAALANDSPDWGIFEGRTGSLLHPITMGSLLLFMIYTGFLGLQWRRQRTIGDEITALKKTLPDLSGASSVQAALDQAKAAEAVDASLVSKLEAALPLENKVQDLVAERKTLSGQNNRDKHYNQGALLAFVGTMFAIEGPLNTYARAGKLFPGPHLYAGAGLVVCWAAASACVPYMTKGNDTARTLHITANLVGLGLFVWQVTSGIPILLKVVELTSWP